MKPLPLRFLSALFLMVLFTNTHLLAQCGGNPPWIIDFSDIICDQPSTRMNFSVVQDPLSGEKVVVYDYTLPVNLEGTVNITAKGGNGGNSSIDCGGMKYGWGGVGMFLSGTVTVGKGSGMIPRGSTIRYILGEHGQYSTDVYTGDQYVRAGGGGGSTAVLFKAPDSTNWQILMIAGGGGGGACECYPTTDPDIHLPVIYTAHEDGYGGDFPYAVSFADSFDANGNPVLEKCFWWSTTSECHVKSVVPHHTDYTLSDNQGGHNYPTDFGGSGGGLSGDGAQAPPCNNGCSGGQNGQGWLSDNTIPNVYAANVTSCLGVQSRSGGRGFTGGGAGYSHIGAAGSGGGGGIFGGASGGGTGAHFQRSGGGGSYIEHSLVTAWEAKPDTTTFEDGYANFNFIPSQTTLNTRPELSIAIKSIAPFCNGTPVQLVAHPYYTDGSFADDFGNLSTAVPVYTWSINGVPVTTGQSFADSVGTINYYPGDTLTCQFWGKDNKGCGRYAIPVSTLILPDISQPEAKSNVVITAEPGNNVCLKRVYDQYGGYNLEAWATFRASATFAPTAYDNGHGSYFFADSVSEQTRALIACEAEYGAGNCTLGTHNYYCTTRPALNYYDSLTSGLLPVSSSLGYYPAPLVTGTPSCNGFNYYYKTGTNQSVPDSGAKQFVFAANANVTKVNQDFATRVITATGFVVVAPHDTIHYSGTDTLFYQGLLGESIVGKFPFIRTFAANGQWQLTADSIGIYTGVTDYQPSYKWYRNGYLQGYGASYTDGNGVVHLDTIPYTTDTLWIRNVNEGDVITCQATSNHCVNPYVSNEIVMHVSEPSTGGVISGPEHPCVNSLVSYQINGAQNALSYVWQIDGPVYSLIATDTTRTFYVGQDTVRLTCMPIGPCGLGDTAHFTVAPAKIITQPCTTPPLVVTTNGVRCEGGNTPTTISVNGSFECYQWSNGASTAAITVFDDGDYYVYLNGCKSEVVTLTSMPAQHPNVSIAISPALPGEEGPWCRTNNHKTISATVTNYTGNPNINYQWYRNGQPYSTQNGGLFLNLNIFNSYDTIQCQITLDETCAIPVWSNKVVLPLIFDNAASSLGVSVSTPQGCSGDTITFTALPYNGGDNPTYTWRIDNVFVSDTTEVYKRAWINNNDYPQTHTIQCTLFGSPLPCRTGSSIKVYSFTYIVNPKVTPTVSISAENIAVCPGTNITYTATGVNGGGAPVYEWFKNNVAVGTNNAIYTDTAVANGDSVYCRFTNTDGQPCTAPPAISNKLGIKVYTPLTPTTVASPSVTCLGNSVNIGAIVNLQPDNYNRTGFAGGYAPSRWTKTIGCNGDITTTLAPASVNISVVHPPYGPSFTTCYNDFSITLQEDAIVSFDWAYALTSATSNDVPYLLIDGIEYQFPEIDYTTPQVANKTGHYSLTVTQGQTLTLRQKGIIYNTQNQSQPVGANTTFTNFTVQTYPGITWYNMPQGGSVIGTALPADDISVTPTSAGTTYYYAEASGTDAACGLRSPVAITVNSPSTYTDAVTACDSYTWIDGNTYTASNNSATYTLTNANGCDSVVTLNLTIHNSTASTIADTACESYTLNSQTYTASGAYTQSLTNSVGCDSTITLNLTINHSNTGTDVITACDSYTWIDGNTYTSSNNSATYTLSNTDGCDSVVTLNLTIHNSTASTIADTACESYTLNSQTYTASGAYTQSLTNSVGCDSTITLNLTINHSNTGTDVITACDSYTWIDGNTYTSSNNSATYTLSNSDGCGSVVTLNLTIHNSTTSTITDIACESYTLNSQTYTASGVYTQSLINSVGCDSVITLNLTINHSNTGTDVITACDSYTWIDGNTYTSSNNSATYTLSNSDGCDSVVILNLTIHNSTASTITDIACESYTLNSQTYTASGAYTQSLINSVGCDSTITLNLTINHSNTGTDVITACDNYTWIDGNTYTSSNNSATYTLSNMDGCDSVVTLNLTIHNSTASTITDTACESYTLNSQTYTASGVYTQSLTNSVGCNSVITLNLTINHSNTGTDIITACDSYTWIDGNTYTSSNNSATYTLSNSDGCDSVVTLSLTINTITQPIIVRDNDTLTTQAFNTYQWLLNGAVINNASGQSLEILVNGNYAVVVSDINGCSDTSETLNITGVGFNSLANGTYTVAIYPNPNTGVFTVKFNDDKRRVIYVTDAIGRLIIDRTPTLQIQQLDLSKNANGIYFLHLVDGDVTQSYKIKVLK